MRPGPGPEGDSRTRTGGSGGGQEGGHRRELERGGLGSRRQLEGRRRRLHGCNQPRFQLYQYSTVQYSTVRYGTVKYGAVRYSEVPYSAVHRMIRRRPRAPTPNS
eukprot:9255299-Pyramimonas_sp.AAC.1